MLFDDISDYEFLQDSATVIISSKTEEVIIQDGSKHKLPVVNNLAMNYLQTKRLKRDNNKKTNLQCDFNKILDEDDDFIMPAFTTTAVPKLFKETVQEDSVKQLHANKINFHLKEGTSNEFSSNNTLLLDDTKPFSITELVSMVNNRIILLHYLRNKNLLRNEELCTKCNESMILQDINQLTDGQRWRCKSCKSTKSIRRTSFFFRCRLSLKHILLIMYFWSTSCQGYITRVFLPSIDPGTVYDYYSFCRDITVEKMKKHPIIFESDGDVTIEIQIDESLFGKSCKYNRGRPYKRKWVFGITEPKKHKCHMEIVLSRDEETLLNIIKKHVPLSANVRIVSDGWASYGKLKDLGYEHCVVIHSEEFVNSDGYHTNSVESVWSQMKVWISSMHGVHEKHFDHYICEFLYRYNYCKGTHAFCWNQLLSDIALFYPCK